MSTIFYFDFISPFSYLQWRRLNDHHPEFAFTPVPILFGVLLNHHGQLGPAEIPPKKKFSFRFVRWQAMRDGVALKFPPAHPFNPLPPLRLSIAGGATTAVIDGIFRHLWEHGKILDDDAQIQALGTTLGIESPLQAIATNETKATLKRNTDQAIADNVFGVPTLRINGELFWGIDATDMALEFAANPKLFDDPEYRRVSDLQAAVTRKK